MKYIYKLRVFIIIIFQVLVGVGSTFAANTVSTKITVNSSIEEIREELKGMKIPVLSFTFEDDQFPSYDVIEPPEGCWGLSIINNEYVKGSLVMTLGEEEIYNSGEYEDKESGVRVKYRGNTSTAQEYILKKSFKIKLSKKADLLLRDDKIYKDKDWILLNGSNDINYVLGTQIARTCGIDWEPQGKAVCVIMNDKYMGYYYLVEAIKASDSRVAIQDTGFIIENDAYWWKPDELYFKTDNLPDPVGWTFKEPDPDDIDEATVDKIKDIVQIFEDALYNFEVTNDIEAMYDKESFSGWILAHDILGTIDGGGSNMYVTKESINSDAPFDTKIKMGPLWDFDTSFRSDKDSHASVFTGNYFWIRQLLLYADFYETVIKKYNEVKDIIIDDIKLEAENYLNNNQDVYKARLIDYRLNLLGRTSLSDPKSDFEIKIKWLEDRFVTLDSLYQNIPVTKIRIHAPALKIDTGKDMQLEAHLYPSIATIKDIEWSSSNPQVVAVSENGFITGVSEGKARITATCGTVSNTCEITVVTPVIEAEQILLNIEATELNVGETIQLEATVLPEETTDKTVIWQSSDEDVATISDEGLLTAIMEGSATITAYCGDVTGICEITVVTPITEAEQIVLNIEETELNVGETIQLEATVLPEETTDKTVIWQSSDEDVVTVSDEGLVTAIMEGSATITAYCGGAYGECKINVIDLTAIESLAANPESRFSIYSIDGIKIKQDCKVEELKALAKGLYIIVSGDKRFKISF